MVNNKNIYNRIEDWDKENLYRHIYIFYVQIF